MFRHRPETIAALTLAAALGLGCLYDVEGDDPIERTKREAAAAERGIFRRRRNQTGFLVKYRRDADAPASRSERQAARKAFGGMILEAHDLPAEPDAPHEAILLRKGQSGFVAISRGGRVGEFSLAGRTYGGAGVTADRGFDVTVRLSEPADRSTGLAEVALTLTPVFRGLAETGGDLRLEELALELTLPAGRALVIRDRSPDGPLARAFRGGTSAEAASPRAVIVEVEPFR